MNKDLFDSMQKQMDPSPEVRTALSEKLARPGKRRIPVRKYVAVAACAALVIGGFSAYSLHQDNEKWMLIIQSFQHNANIQHLHSYVIVDGLDFGTTLSGEDATAELNEEEGAEDTYSSGVIDRNTEAPSATESSPSSDRGAQNDLFSISQDEAIRLYDILWDHFLKKYGQQEESLSPNWPDWYGGGYLNNDRPDRVARLTIVLVKDYDTPALRQEIYDFLGSDHVDFQSGKYARSYLLELQKKIMDYFVIRRTFAGCGLDEENNHLELTLTEVTDEVLVALAELDPEDDAIYVQVGRLATTVAMGEDLVMPGGAVILEDDENLIAEEPWVDSRDSAYYNVEHLPEQKQPAVEQSVPEEEELDPRTAVTYDPRTGKTTVRRYSTDSSEKSGDTSSSTRAYDPGA